MAMQLAPMFSASATSVLYLALLSLSESCPWQRKSDGRLPALAVSICSALVAPRTGPADLWAEHHPLGGNITFYTNNRMLLRGELRYD